MKKTEGGAYSCDSGRRTGPGSRCGFGIGKGGAGPGIGPPLFFSLVVVAALQVLTLNVPSAVVCARELNPVLVHTPADAPFTSARWLALRDGKV